MIQKVELTTSRKMRLIEYMKIYLKHLAWMRVGQTYDMVILFKYSIKIHIDINNIIIQKNINTLRLKI